MSATVLLTGLPSSGKSTLARALGGQLSRTERVEVLDGDLVRREFFPELGFSKEDRSENVRRVGSLARTLNRNGVIAVVSMIAPFRDARDSVRAVHLAEDLDFLEVFVHAPVEVCAERDVKGLYAKAVRGEIQSFTGVSDPYEEPLTADVTVPTDQWPVERCVAEIYRALREKCKQDVC